MGRRVLTGWEAEPGTGLQWDPTTGQLLAVLRPMANRGSQRQPARPVLIDGDRLTLRVLERAVSQAQWLPAG